MTKYLCRIDDIDDVDEWHEIEAFSPRRAALDCAEAADHSSAGEMLQKPDDECVVMVKDHGQFKIGVEYEKRYYTKDG